MNNPKLYTVKEAAKIVGVSTNTLYKYLDEGKIHAARGSAVQGRFRIPESALEEFLGIKLSEPQEAITTNPEPVVEAVIQQLTTSNPTTKHAHFPLKVVRLLLVCALLAVLIDLFIAKSVSLPGTIARLCFLLIMLFMAYQEGGYRRSRQAI
jgi:excisionase family DNA binding protein